MYSAQAGNMDVCNLLLKCGANAQETNNVGKTSKDLAADWGHPFGVNEDCWFGNS